MKTNVFLNPKIILALIILYPLLLIWQGLDFTDIGYSLTNYSQTFNEPESVSYGFVNWLTNIIGGLWLLLFGNSLGLLGVNIAGVLVVYLTMFFCYLILKPYIEQKYLLLGLFLALILKWHFFLSYNSLTSLFFVASAFFLIKGLKSTKHWWIIISSFVLGLNIFIRLPNILGFSLISCIFFYGYITKATLSTQIKQSIYFIAGYISAILIAILAMKILNHYDTFINSLNDLFNLGLDSQSHHGFKKLLVTYIKNYCYVIIFIIAGIFFTLIMTRFFSWFKNRYLHYGLIILLSIAISIFSIYARDLTGNVYLLVTGMLYLILIGYSLHTKSIDIQKKIFNHAATGNCRSSNDLRFRLISFVSLLILVITPLGSGNGLLNSVYGIWLPIPIAFMYILKLKELNIVFSSVIDKYPSRFGIGLEPKSTNIAKTFIIVFFVIFSLLLSYKYTYRDEPNRIEMRYSVEHPRLKGIFTTKERAVVVQELLDELDNVVKPGDYLLAWEATPMLHFLTKTKPYLYNSWPDLATHYSFEKMLVKAERERAKLPVIVRAKAKTQVFRWPKERVELKDLESDSKTANRASINKFIEDNKYSLLWENDFFEVMAPPKE